MAAPSVCFNILPSNTHMWLYNISFKVVLMARIISCLVSQSLGFLLGLFYGPHQGKRDMAMKRHSLALPPTIFSWDIALSSSCLVTSNCLKWPLTSIKTIGTFLAILKSCISSMRSTLLAILSKRVFKWLTTFPKFHLKGWLVTPLLFEKLV